MRILHQEMNLREETRAAEQARLVETEKTYAGEVQLLATRQLLLAERTDGVVNKISELPNGPSTFALELAILTRVTHVMHEAQQLLTIPATGDATIAAETEAIELLLQARRISPNSSGGGSGSSPGGGGTGTTSQSALALLGSGTETKAAQGSRSVRQATGSVGGELPAEYQLGLDAFFQALENSGPPRSK